MLFPSFELGFFRLKGKKMNKHTKFITRTAIIAALYAALTLIFYPIAFGNIQARVSEALCILPLFMPEAIPGLTIGCLVANLFSPNGILDAVVGTSATLLSSVLTFFLGKAIKKDATKILAGILPTTIFNAVLIPFVIFSISELAEMYLITFVEVGAGELIVLCALGIPLYFALSRAQFMRKIMGYNPPKEENAQEIAQEKE
jgi:uncharacterized membrane protein